MSTDHQSDPPPCLKPAALDMSTSWMLSHRLRPALKTSLEVAGRDPRERS